MDAWNRAVNTTDGAHILVRETEKQKEADMISDGA